MGAAGERRPLGVQSAVAYAGAAALIVAAVWYGLVAAGITADSEPELSGSFEERFDTYYGWLVTTFEQERYYSGFAIVGFLCFAATALLARARVGRGSPLALLGAYAVAAGAGFWIAANVAALGGHRAVGRMFERRDSPEVVNSVNLTIDLVDDALELAAFALLGAGMLALAWPALRSASREVAWGRFTAAVGLVLLATAGAYAASAYDLVDLLLVLGGAVLVPAWLVWSGRLLREPA